MEKKETLLKVENLNKIFKSNNLIVKAIDNVSFKVKKGEVVGLIGESGSGKTTVGRTIIGLHEATSGVMELEGNDITNYSSRKTRKKIVKDIQMIFQDPYSSLNGQKNVMSIVSEPIISNKLWKSDLSNFLANRDKILKYYKYSLIEKFDNEFNDYRKFANKNAYEFTKKLNEKLNKYKINESENKEVNINFAINLYYRERHEINLKILDKLVDVEEILTNIWLKFNKNIINLKNIPQDEKALIKIENDIEKLKLLTKKSQNEVKLSDELSVQENLLTQAKKNFKTSKDNSKRSFLKIIKLLKNDLKSEKIERKLSLNNNDYSFHADNEKSIKLKMAFLYKLWKQNLHKQWFDSSIVTHFLKNNFYKKIEKTKFESIFKNENEIMSINRNKKINTIKKQISELKSKIIIEKNNDQSKEIDKNKLFLQRKIEEFHSATIKFSDETKTFLEKFNENHTQKFNDDLFEINKYIIEYKNLKSDNSNLFKNIIDKINHKYKENKLTSKAVKLLIKKEEDKNSSLEIELKNIMKNIKIIKSLFSLRKTPKFLLYFSLKKLIIRSKVYKALRHSGLKSSYAYRYPHEFSGGMRQRVGIARAIIAEPKLIIADEPIAALDLSIQAQVVNMLLDQKDRLGLAMIFIAHDLSMVKFNSDRVLIMHLGRIVEHGETKEIFRNPKHPYTKNLISSMPSVSKVKGGIKVSTFEPEYLKKYTAINQPEQQRIKNNHFVLATKAQLKKWK